VIDGLVVEGDAANARMTFSGLHQGTMWRYPPTNRRVPWAGAALFKFNDDLIADLWVLGDLNALESQVGSETRCH
jgi:predicted ester cyclase